MPSTKRNWAKLFIGCPFKAKVISSSNQIRKLTTFNLPFNSIDFSSQQDRRVKYGFVSHTRGKVGVFIIKEFNSNKIVAMGSSSSDLYEQIILHIRRYQIALTTATLAVVFSPVELIEDVVFQIKRSYLNEAINSVYDDLLPFFISKKAIPLEKINFFPLYDYNPRSIRHKYRVKTNIADLQYRPGIYIIQERDKGGGKSEWETVYVGKASNLNGRINAHFVPSQIANHDNANYFCKKQSHEYQIGVIEIPISKKPKNCSFDKHLLSFETALIHQLEPRDNRKKKVLLEATTSGYVPVLKEGEEF